MRKRRYHEEQLARAVAIAAETSQHNAERATGISRRTIGLEMKRRGVPARRPGNYNEAEKSLVAGKLVAL